VLELGLAGQVVFAGCRARQALVFGAGVGVGQAPTQNAALGQVGQGSFDAQGHKHHGAELRFALGHGGGWGRAAVQRLVDHQARFVLPLAGRLGQLESGRGHGLAARAAGQDRGARRRHRQGVDPQRPFVAGQRFDVADRHHFSATAAVLALVAVKHPVAGLTLRLHIGLKRGQLGQRHTHAVAAGLQVHRLRQPPLRCRAQAGAIQRAFGARGAVQGLQGMQRGVQARLDFGGQAVGLALEHRLLAQSVQVPAFEHRCRQQRQRQQQRQAHGAAA
jgi:hypothetical protein